MILQLNHPIYVYVTSKNMEGRALGWLDYGASVSLIWIVALENKEVWLVKNEEIRMVENFTMDYAKPSNAEASRETHEHENPAFSPADSYREPESKEAQALRYQLEKQQGIGPEGLTQNDNSRKRSGLTKGRRLTDGR